MVDLIVIGVGPELGTGAHTTDYMAELVCSNSLAGRNAARVINGEEPLVLPETIMLGTLCRYITQASPEDFQPMKANYGLLPPLEDFSGRDKRLKAQMYGERSGRDLDAFLALGKEDWTLINAGLH